MENPTLTNDEVQERKRGTMYAFGAYLLWGLFPIYWKWLHAFSAVEILAHRILWSFLFYWCLVVFIRGEGAWLWLKLFARKGSRLAILAASILLTCNWLLYIWSVNNGHILEASLGYFITPLLNILMGRVVLKEHLSHLRWFAVALATVGAGVLALQTSGSLLIALTLALTFSTYGLIRKQIRADVFETSTAETFVMIVPAAIVIAYFRLSPAGVTKTTALDALLLFGSGVVTGLPLIWFAQAARKLPLSILGFFQYIAPIIQFALGVFAYGEPLSTAKLQAFAFIWVALAIFSYESLQARRKAIA